MDALEQLSHYRHVDPVDDGIVAATVDTIAAAVAVGHRDTAVRRRPAPSWRRTRGRRIAIAAGAVLTAMGAGSGIAAATGLFSPTQQPPRVQSFMGSLNPAKVPGATLQLSIPGPEGTTLQVVTDDVTTSDQVADCVALGIIGPDGQPESTGGRAGCSTGNFEPGGTAPTLRQMTPSINLQIWKAPSGANYFIIFGKSIPGVARVTLSGSDGVAATAEPANPNGYVIFSPAASLASHSHLDFTDKSGKIMFSQDVNS